MPKPPRTQPSWHDLERAPLELRSVILHGGPLTEELQELSDALREFRHRARERARQNLLHALGDVGEDRYYNNVDFHAQVDLLVQFFVGVIFDETPLDREEIDKRIDGIGRIFRYDEETKTYGVLQFNTRTWDELGPKEGRPPWFPQDHQGVHLDECTQAPHHTGSCR